MNRVVNFPACGVYISQLIRYSRACDYYHDFPDRGLLPTRNGYWWFGWHHHHDLVNRFGISVSQLTMYMFRVSLSQYSPFIIHDLSQGL